MDDWMSEEHKAAALEGFRANPVAVSYAQQQAILDAFRKVTGWTDAEVLHYSVCESYCNPICGAEEDACEEARKLSNGRWDS